MKIFGFGSLKEGAPASVSTLDSDSISNREPFRRHITLMEHIPYPNLSRWLQQPTRTWSQRKKIIQKALYVVARLHRLGFRHFDLKAGNFLIDPISLSVFLVDYDHIQRESVFLNSPCLQRHLVHTPGFLDPLLQYHPKLARGFLDVWAAGAMSREILLGEKCVNRGYWWLKKMRGEEGVEAALWDEQEKAIELGLGKMLSELKVRSCTQLMISLSKILL